MRPAIPPNALIGKAISGSTLYGLATPESDLDVVYIVDESVTSKEMHISQSELDERIIPHFRFVEGVTKSSFNYVDIQLASTTKWNERHPLLPYVKAARHDHYKYVDALQRHARADLYKYVEAEVLGARHLKSLKMVVRNLMMIQRKEDMGEDFDPTFSWVERDRFYNIYGTALKLDRNPQVLVEYFKERNLPFHSTLMK